MKMCTAQNATARKKVRKSACTIPFCVRQLPCARSSRDRETRLQWWATGHGKCRREQSGGPPPMQSNMTVDDEALVLFGANTSHPELKGEFAHCAFVDKPSSSHRIEAALDHDLAPAQDPRTVCVSRICIRFFGDILLAKVRLRSRPSSALPLRGIRPVSTRHHVWQNSPPFVQDQLKRGDLAVRHLHICSVKVDFLIRCARTKNGFDDAAQENRLCPAHRRIVCECRKAGERVITVSQFGTLGQDIVRLTRCDRDDGADNEKNSSPFGSFRKSQVRAVRTDSALP